MYNILFLIGTIFTGTMLSGQSITASFSENKLGINLDLVIETSKSKVTLCMSGPADKWFAFGFGKQEMEGSYALNVNEQKVEERYLQGRNEGELLPQSLNILSDSLSNNSYKVCISRSLKGKDERYFSFPRGAKVVPIIYAVGKDERKNKKHKQKGSAFLNFK